MERKYFLTVASILFFTAASLNLLAQSGSKLPIDSAAIANWYDLGRSSAIVSANGKYFMYLIYNLPVGKQTLVIQSTQDAWKKEFVDAQQGVFSLDGKYAIFQSADSLIFLALGKDQMECIAGVSSFTYPSNKLRDNIQLLAYRLKGGDVLIRDLVTGEETKIGKPTDFRFNHIGSALLIQKMDENSELQSLDWFNIKTGSTKSIWSNKDNKITRIYNYSFDGEGKQVVIITTDKNNAGNNIVWYYNQHMHAAEIKVSNAILRRSDDLVLSKEATTFSENGKYIFFTLQAKDKSPVPTDPRAVQVDVWNYKDLVLQPLQIFFKDQHRNIPQTKIRTQYAASISIDNNFVCQLENDRQKIEKLFNSDFVIIKKGQDIGDRVWLEYQKYEYGIISLKDGTEKYLFNRETPFFWLSPNKRFLVYFDTEFLQYYSYDFEKNTTKKISASIPFKLTDNFGDEWMYPNLLPVHLGIYGWLDNGRVIISDNYDLWTLDPSGQYLPENITRGCGRINNIRFDLMSDDGLQPYQRIYSVNKTRLLKAFYNHTKQIGFYQLDINKGKSPELISLHNCLMSFSADQTRNLWIVKKETMAQAPNFYSTSDFKTFKQLTNIQPPKKYRWGTSQLVSWKTYDGEDCEGILYKPEDFDSTKKYPVIFNYYEIKSDNLHRFLTPELIHAEINIPWFVSRGFLVFNADIHYTVGSVAKSVVNSVIPGAHALLKRPYVDSTAMGLQGHSFGGYETNILVTESNLFAAAAEGAGPSDLVSSYGSLMSTDWFNGQFSYQLERGKQLRLNAPLWEDQRAYIENSPIFKAGKVTTPLLIMHNKGDESVPWGQAVELFIALRRLEKPAWMLQYDKGGHGVEDTRDQLDFTTRMTQFFDHYLKGVPAPKWMTKGIPATLKGVVTGYELDPNGSCSNSCPVCKRLHHSTTSN